MSDEEEYDSDRDDTDVDEEGKVSDCDAGKRAYHNLLERKRRDNIKDSFCQLRDVVPQLKKKSASRVQILKKACDFIRKHGRNIDLEEIEEEAASLAEENRLLEEKFAEFKRAVENNDVETIERLNSEELPLKDRRNLLEDEETDSEDGESSEEDYDDDGGSSPPGPSFAEAMSPRKKIKRI